MKKKLTLSIDEKILARAKKYCAKNKISLSSLIEQILIDFISKSK
jgi:predicted HicB family RNase H-like nuclease